MTTFTQNITNTYYVVECYTCGASFGIESTLHKRAVEHKKGSVYCPACGRGMHWTGETQEQKRIKWLQQDVKSLNSMLERSRSGKEKAEHSLRTTKGVVTKLKNRVAKGVCPCCNRSFQNLHRHMKSQHPDFAKETES